MGHNGDGTVVQLEHPVEFGKQTITEVTVKSHPTGADLLELDRADGDFGKTLRMIAAFCGLSWRTVQQLHVSDITTIGEVCADAMGKSQ